MVTRGNSWYAQYFYKPIKMLCEDDRIRTVYVKCHCYDGSFAADTFFSVPAYTQAYGKTVRGFMGTIEAFETETADDPNIGKQKFYAYKNGKNGDLILGRKMIG